MVRYLCHNCHDMALRSITQVASHVWDKHRVEVTKRTQLVKRAEDARLPLKKTRVQNVFRCERCNVVLKDIPFFLAHLYKWHRIHISYQKGLRGKRVFFGNSKRFLNEENGTPITAISISGKGVPLSERPYEPRKSEDEDLVKQHQRKAVGKTK